MSNAYLSPILQDAQFNDDGTFLVGGLIWFYEAGTSTPILAYTTPVADTPWGNPIQLNARGETGGEIWLKAGSSYKIILEGPPEYGQTHGVVVSTFDNITGVNDPGTNTIQNWVDFSGTPTYISATSFSVTGDQRTTFLESRRLKMENGTSTTYGTVVSATYATGVTTIEVSPDYGQSVDAGIDSVSYGFIETGNVSSIPVPVNAGSALSGSQYQMWIDYDGTNLKWSKDADAASASWPINATTATNAYSNAFSTQQTSLQGSLSARRTGTNDVSLVNDLTSWGLLEQSVGYALFYNRSNQKYSYGGFTLPDPSVSKYIKLPNDLIVQFGQGTASTGGTTVTYPITFPTQCVCVLVTAISATTIATSANNLNTNGFTALAASSTPVSYIAFGY